MKMLQVSPIAVNTYPAERPVTLLEHDESESRTGDRCWRPRAGYSTFDIFQWLSREAQQAFILASRQRQFADNCRIYSQSEPGNEMYRIVCGCVRISVLRHDGREALYLVLGPGDCFGICSLLDSAPRHYTASAKGDVEVQVLRREVCERLRTNHASFNEGLIRYVSRHMRLLSEYFANYTLDELSCRVALRLLKAQKSTVVRARRIRVTVRLSQNEIALMVGASRQAVNKVLRRFQEGGLILLEYGRIQILDVERLQSLT